MKFFISIIMVLLMLNFFAQAQVVADPPGATALPVDNTKTKKVISQGDSMEVTAGIVNGEGNPVVEGEIKPCNYRDAQGKCVPMPNGAITGREGALTDKEVNSTPTATSPVNQTE